MNYFNLLSLIYSLIAIVLAEMRLDIFGLKLISETGVPFDPASHEACHARFDPEQPENSVLEIIQPGFVSRGKVLRYATVVVNRHD